MKDEARENALKIALGEPRLTDLATDEEITGFRVAFYEGWRACADHAGEPIPMLLYCPRCFEQHVDEAKPDVCEACGHDKDEHGLKSGCGTHKTNCPCEEFTAWLNPPHKSHRCNFCNHVWRPSDRPTDGVQSLETAGKADGSPRPQAFANGKDFDEAVAYASKRHHAGWVEIKSAEDLPLRPGHYYVTLADGRVGASAFYCGAFDKSAIAWLPRPEAFKPTPLPKAAEPVVEDTCPECRHRTHEPGGCLNMASDSDCDCKFKPVSEETKTRWHRTKEI